MIVEIKLERTNSGSFALEEVRKVPCINCDGKGSYERNPEVAFSLARGTYIREYDTERCRVCGGTGKVEPEVNIELYGRET